MWQPTNLENDLVKLIPLQNEHFEELYNAASDPLIWEQHPNSDRYQKEVFQVYFDEAIEMKSAFIFLDKNENKIIGSSRFYNYYELEKSIAIGYTFLIRSHWGGKYNAAAKQLMIEYAFLHVDTIYFHIATNNIRSQNGTMRIGATLHLENKTESGIVTSLHHEYVIKKK